MGVVDKTVDTAGGAVKGGVKGLLSGFATAVIGGAVLGAGAVALGLAAFAGGTAAIALAPVAIGAAAGATLGGIFSVPVATTFAAIGALFGGAKRLAGGKSEEPSLDQQIAAAKMQNNELNSMIAKRQAAASSFDNPDATTGFAARAQTAPQQTQTTDTPDKPGYVAKTQTTTTTVEPQRA